LKTVSRRYANRFHHRSVNRFSDCCDVFPWLSLKQINSNEWHVQASE